MSSSIVIFGVKVKLLRENTTNTDRKHMTHFMLHLTEVRVFSPDELKIILKPLQSDNFIICLF